MNEQNNQTMSVRQAVENIILDLGNIPVPISQMESVGFPIARSIQNLKSICAAWDAEEALQKQAQQGQAEGIKLEVIPEGGKEDAQENAQENAPEEEEENG